MSAEQKHNEQHKKPKGKKYRGIICNGLEGILILAEEHFEVRPLDEATEADDDTNEGQTKKLLKRQKVPWETVVDIKKSAAKAKNHKIKVTIWNKDKKDDDEDEGSDSSTTDRWLIQLPTRERLCKIYDKMKETKSDFEDFYQGQDNEEDQEQEEGEEEEPEPSVVEDAGVRNARHGHGHGGGGGERDSTTNLHESIIHWDNPIDDQDASDDNDGGNPQENLTAAATAASWSDSFQESSSGFQDALSPQKKTKKKEKTANTTTMDSFLAPLLEGDGDEALEAGEEAHEVAEESIPPPPPVLVFDEVVYEGDSGQLVLEQERLLFKEPEDEWDLFQLPWDQLHKHRISSAKGQKCNLALFVGDNGDTQETFEMPNRSSLKEVKHEITVRLEYYHQQQQPQQQEQEKEQATENRDSKKTRRKSKRNSVKSTETTTKQPSPEPFIEEPPKIEKLHKPKQLETKKHPPAPAPTPAQVDTSVVVKPQQPQKQTPQLNMNTKPSWLPDYLLPPLEPLRKIQEEDDAAILKFQFDGKPGRNASNGADAKPTHRDPGSHGNDGGNAGTATAGGNAQCAALVLQSIPSKEMVHVEVLKVLDVVDDNMKKTCKECDRNFPMASCPKITLTASGKKHNYLYACKRACLLYTSPSPRD